MSAATRAVHGKRLGLFAILRDKRELQRLNHIFIPATKEERDKFRTSRTAKLLRPWVFAFFSLSREGRGLFALTVMIGFAGLDVGQTQVYLMFAMLAGFTLASLAARPFFRARGLSLRVAAAPRVSLGEPLELLVELQNAGERALTDLRVGQPFLPWDGTWLPGPQLGVPTLEPGERRAVVARAVFVARGEHHLDPFSAAVLVPLGLTLGPRRESEGARFLVVPKLAKVERLRVVHRVPEQRVTRVTSRSQGEGEFAGVRRYRAGDPLKHLHARTWARTGVPHIKTYLTERSDRVGLIVMLDGAEATEREKEAALSLAAGIAARLCHDGDGVGDLILDGEAVRIEPRLGRAALEAVLDRLGVVRLTAQDLAREDAALELSGAHSSVVLVTADKSPARVRLARGLAERGVPLRWFVVAEDETAPPPEGVVGVGPDEARRGLPEGAEVVSLAAIEAGEALVL